MICEKVEKYKCKYCGVEYRIEEYNLALKHNCCRSCKYANYNSKGLICFSHPKCKRCGEWIGMTKRIDKWELKEELDDSKR